MDADDQPVGRVLSRREVLALLGAAGAAALAACATPTVTPTAAPTLPPLVQTEPPATLPPASTAVPTSATAAPSATTVTAASATAPAATEAVALPACLVRPAQTEGPYFVDEMLNRADLRSDPSGGAADRGGVPLVLTMRVAQLNGAACTALAGAQVDLWHCDADGVYSDVGSAAGQQFLRGYQLTDATGAATFTTIYPGWYQGRTAHIHFKIRTDPAAGPVSEFTSQLYFDESINDTIFGLAPYNHGGRRTRNADDGVYQNGGDQLLLALTTIEEGYAAVFDIGLVLS